VHGGPVLDQEERAAIERHRLGLDVARHVVRAKGGLLHAHLTDHQVGAGPAARRVTRPLGDMVEHFRNVSEGEGDLTHIEYRFRARA